MSTKQKKPAGKQRSAIADVVAREYTVHMHKRVSISPRREKRTPSTANSMAHDGEPVA